MQYFHSALAVTVATTGLFDAYDLIGYDGAKITADDALVLGMAQSPNTVIGDPGSVMVLGNARVRASGVITAGDRLISAAGGGVKAAVKYQAGPPVVDASVNDFAIALTAAADGGFVDILIR